MKLANATLVVVFVLGAFSWGFALGRHTAPVRWHCQAGASSVGPVRVINGHVTGKTVTTVTRYPKGCTP